MSHQIQTKKIKTIETNRHAVIKKMIKISQTKHNCLNVFLYINLYVIFLYVIFFFSSHKYIISAQINARVIFIHRVNRREPSELSHRYGRLRFHANLLRLVSLQLTRLMMPRLLFTLFMPF